MWFKVDDGFAEHPKTRAAVEAAEAAHPGRGAHVIALWTAAGNRCARANGEGVVTALMLSDAAYFSKADAVVVKPALIEIGLWHDAKTIRRCRRCSDALKESAAKKLGPADVYFHDWLDYQFTKAEVTNEDHERRGRALKKNKSLCDAIKDRDRNHCRYCADKVRWQDKRSGKAAQYDHRDPHGINSLENVVVACKECNEAKGDRTPEEWAREGGRSLLREPDRYPSDPWPELTRSQVGVKSEPDTNRDQSQTGADSLTPLARVGGRSQVGPGPELVRVGSGPGLPGVESFHLTERTEQQ